MAVRWHDEATRAEWVGSVPFARSGGVEEIAAVALFLPDPAKAGYVTGQTIAAGGGFTATGRRNT